MFPIGYRQLGAGLREDRVTAETSNGAIAIARWN